MIARLTTTITLGAVLGLVIAGCTPGSVAGDGHTVVPNTDGGPRPVDGEGRDSGENMSTYKKQFQRLRDERAARAAADEDPSFAVCEDLCGLMSSICEVKAKLCGVADEHPGEPSYQKLCREAHNECREAQDSCVACTEQTEAPQDEAQPGE